MAERKQAKKKKKKYVNNKQNEQYEYEFGHVPKYLFIFMLAFYS